MPKHILNQEKRDFITDYLANHAQRDLLTPEFIEEYREAHKNRAKTGRRGRISRSLLKHKNSAYCNICDEDLKPWDDVYYFFVHGTIIYHVDCFDKTRPRKQLSVIYQDRAFRAKHAPVEKPPEEPLPDYIIDLRVKSDKLSEELRKKHGPDV